MDREEKREIEKKRNYLVSKENTLITSSRTELSLQQLRILAYLISKIKPGDAEGTIYEFDISEFLKVCGKDNNGFYYGSIKEDIKSIKDISSWIEVNPSTGEEVLFSWLDKVVIIRKTGKVRVSFHSSVTPYLFDLTDHFTVYNLRNVLCLSSKYSFRLYEIFTAYKYKKVYIVQIEELKKRIGAENYKLFGNLKQRILDPSVKEINEYTDLNVTMEVRKINKQADSLVFTIEEKEHSAYRMLQRNQATKLSMSTRQKKPREEKEQTYGQLTMDDL